MRKPQSILERVRGVFLSRSAPVVRLIAGFILGCGLTPSFAQAPPAVDQNEMLARSSIDAFLWQNLGAGYGVTAPPSVREQK